MANVIQIGVDAANSALDNQTTRVDGGVVEVYAGTPPADIADTLTGNTLLVEATLQATAAGSAANKEVYFNLPVQDLVNNNDGYASFYIMKTSGGVREIMGTVDTANASMIVATTTVVAGGTFDISSIRLWLP